MLRGTWRRKDKIRKPQLEINHQKLPTMGRFRQIAWVVCLILILALTFAGAKPGFQYFRQAFGVRDLLKAGASISIEEPNNPFVCLRKSGNSARAQIALQNISDAYLRGVGLCMAGETGAGREALQEAGEHSNGMVQYAAAISTIDSQSGAEIIGRAELSEGYLTAVIQNLVAQQYIDPYQGLRVLAQQATDQPGTWAAWLKGSSRLEAAKDWQAALNWINEGLSIAPPEVKSSLYLRAGQIYQSQADPRDYPAALASYNRAIEEGGWIYPDEEVNVHILRGDVYSNLKDEFSPEQAIKEYQRALELQPGNYWAQLSIGHVYMYNLKELDAAESYYRQALEADELSPYAYFHIGEVYRARGNKEVAAEWYNLALERQPNWQPALDSLSALEEQR